MSAEARPTGAETEREVIAKTLSEIHADEMLGGRPWTVERMAAAIHSDLAALRSTETPREGEVVDVWREKIYAVLYQASRDGLLGDVWSLERLADEMFARTRPILATDVIGYVVVQKRRSDPITVDGVILSSFAEARKALDFWRAEHPERDFYLAPVGPALSPVEPEEGV